MMKPSNFIFALLVGIPAVLFSCSKPSKVEPDVTLPAEYELREIHYFKTDQVGLDTVMVKLNGSTLTNPGNVLMTQTFESNYDDLQKTSRFEISNLQTLPTDIKLESFAVEVPERWNIDGTYGYFSEKFMLSSSEQQKPYGAYKKENITVRVPARSAVVVERQIEAYPLGCSFRAVVVNKATGQQYPVMGNWRGVSHYNNTSVTLTERAL